MNACSSTAPPRALAGRRVVELADESFAYCGKLMADMGADVIKVEPCGGCQGRRRPPFLEGQRGPDASLDFLYLNTSKRSVTLDVETTEGRALLLRLIAASDVVIEDAPPGALEAEGISFERAREANPTLVWTSITGFGQTGPHAGYRSSELVAGAMGGSMFVTGEAEDPPTRLAGEQALLMAATCAANSTMIALLSVRRRGRGQRVDISAQETTLAISHISGVGKYLEDGIVPTRVGTGLTASVPSGTYACRDGSVYLMVNRPAHWKALAQWIHETTGNTEVVDPMFEGPSANRIEYRMLLDVFIGDMTALHTVDEIYHEGQRRHIAFTPLNTPAQVADDAHLRARGYFQTLAHPSAGELGYPGAPYRHERTPWRMHRPAPRLGEHNDEVYGGVLGLDASQIAGLQHRGVV